MVRDGMVSKPVILKSQKNIGKDVKSFVRNNFVLIAFIILIIAGGILSPTFLTLNNIRTVLLQNSIYAICALGMLFIVITGGIDLAVGSYVVEIGRASCRERV